MEGDNFDPALITFFLQVRFPLKLGDLLIRASTASRTYTGEELSLLACPGYGAIRGRVVVAAREFGILLLTPLPPPLWSMAGREDIYNILEKLSLYLSWM